MAGFRYYNVQLLPIDSHKTNDVGVRGYRRLLSSLKDEVQVAVKKKTLEQLAYGLRTGMFFSAFTVNVDREDYGIGKFLKFDIADSVVNIYTQQTIYKAGPGASAHPEHYRFVFDYKRHILAVEDTHGRLPSTGQMIKALYHLLEPLAQTYFNQHRLTIDQLTSSAALHGVYKEAKGFKRVDVTLKFANSDKLVNDLLEELKENNCHEINHVEKSDKDGLMDRPTEFGKAALELAKKYGNATINYMIALKGGVLKRKIFRMWEHPVRVTLRERKDESESEYLGRVYESIAVADKKATE